MPSSLDLQSLSQLESAGNGIVVCNFWEEWCKPCTQMNTIFDQLAEQHPHFKFFKVQAEKLPDVTEKFEISAVPTFLFFKNQKVIDKIEGANAPELASKVTNLNATNSKSGESTEGMDLNARLTKLVSKAPVMLFMKGVPDAPKCGFSRKIVDILKQQKIEFDSFDILTDEEARQGLKTLSNWPTYPQLYAEGKLIGGLDIVKEMADDGQLQDIVPKPKTVEDLNTRLSILVNKAPVMLFMKGIPDAPKCGFSSKIVDILRNAKVEFSSFDILTDEEVRQGLKTFSNWPTYPQLFAHGALVGGLDVVKELQEEGQLLDALK